jgi:hypothetical protein
MTRGRLGKRERQDDLLRKRRAQAASGLAMGAKVPPKAIPVASASPRPSEPLPAALLGISPRTLRIFFKRLEKARAQKAISGGLPPQVGK